MPPPWNCLKSCKNWDICGSANSFWDLFWEILNLALVEGKKKQDHMRKVYKVLCPIHQKKTCETCFLIPFCSYNIFFQCRLCYLVIIIWFHITWIIIICSTLYSGVDLYPRESIMATFSTGSNAGFKKKFIFRIAQHPARL